MRLKMKSDLALLILLLLFMQEYPTTLSLGMQLLKLGTGLHLPLATTCENKLKNVPPAPY